MLNRFLTVFGWLAKIGADPDDSGKGEMDV